MSASASRKKRRKMSAPSRSSSLSRRAILALPFVMLAAGAAAQSRVLDAPRASGAVGERFDGYAVVRDQSQAASLGPLVDRVNAERRQVYAQRAAAERAPADQIGRVYAREIFNSAPAGTWFLQESGQWVRK
jgi:uncharacterized protein YdbL (DUF1318 family)